MLKTLHKLVTKMTDRFYTFPDDWQRPEAKPPTLPQCLDGAIQRFNFSLNAWSCAWFFLLLEELKKDPGMDWIVDGGIWQQLILEAWTEQRIFGLCMQETDSLFDHARAPGKSKKFATYCKFFMHTAYTGTADYVLPCFLITSKHHQGSSVSFRHDCQTHTLQCGDSIELLWVAPRLRRRGLGTFLTMQYPHPFVYDPLENVAPFWNRLGYTCKSLPQRLLSKRQSKKTKYF